MGKTLYSVIATLTLSLPLFAGNVHAEEQKQQRTEQNDNYVVKSRPLFLHPAIDIATTVCSEVLVSKAEYELKAAENLGKAIGKGIGRAYSGQRLFKFNQHLDYII